jgi:hypothetical protein
MATNEITVESCLEALRLHDERKADASAETNRLLSLKVAELEAEVVRLKFGKAQWYQTAQHYRQALQEIRDATPANKHAEWPHHHFYLATASKAINHCDEPLNEDLEQ